MAAHKNSLILVAVVLYVVSGFSRTFMTVHAQTAPQRIVSIIPSTTEMLFAMGAGPASSASAVSIAILPRR
jgi:ABC-type hemin transport system substrate-binding protein